MADVRRKTRERKKKVQYASPVRKRCRHKRKAHHMSSSTSSSGKMHLLATFKNKIQGIGNWRDDPVWNKNIQKTYLVLDSTLYFKTLFRTRDKIHT